LITDKTIQAYNFCTVDHIFILILPANVYAAINKIDYEKGNYSGNGLKYLWFRIPLQIFFIEWVWYFGI